MKVQLPEFPTYFDANDRPYRTLQYTTRLQSPPTFMVAAIDLGPRADEWMVYSVRLGSRVLVGSESGNAMFPGEMLLMPFDMGDWLGKQCVQVGEDITITVTFAGDDPPATIAPVLLDSVDAMVRWREWMSTRKPGLSPRPLSAEDASALVAAWEQIVGTADHMTDPYPPRNPRQTLLPLNTGSTPVAPRTPWWIESTAIRAFKIDQLTIARIDDWWIHAFTIAGKDAIRNNESGTGFPASNLLIHSNKMIGITDVPEGALVRLQISYVGQLEEGAPFLGTLIGLEASPEP